MINITQVLWIFISSLLGACRNSLWLRFPSLNMIPDTWYLNIWITLKLMFQMDIKIFWLPVKYSYPSLGLTTHTETLWAGGSLNTIYIATVACLGFCFPACYGMGKWPQTTVTVSVTPIMVCSCSGPQGQWVATFCHVFSTPKLANVGSNAWQALDFLSEFCSTTMSLFTPRDSYDSLFTCSALLRTASLPYQRISSL